MRHQLGLDLPERRIGLSAHDFAQLLGTRRRHPDVTPRRSAARRRSPRASCTGWKPSPARTRWKAAQAAGENYVRLPTSSISPTTVTPIAQPEPKPPRATRPLEAVGHRDRGLAARSLYDLRQIYSGAGCRSIPSTCRCRQPTADSAIHASLGDFTMEYTRRHCPTIPRASCADRRTTFCAADGATRGAGAVVAAFPAHRYVVWRLGNRRAASMSPASTPRCAARSRSRSINGRIFHLSARADRIEHRSDRSYRPARLQDRPAAHGQAGAHGPVAAAHAGSRDPARGRICRTLPRDPPSANWSMSGSAATIRPAKSSCLN